MTWRQGEAPVQVLTPLPGKMRCMCMILTQCEPLCADGLQCCHQMLHHTCEGGDGQRVALRRPLSLRRPANQASVDDHASAEVNEGSTRMHHATPKGGLANEVRTMLLLRELPMVTFAALA